MKPVTAFAGLFTSLMPSFHNEKTSCSFTQWRQCFSWATHLATAMMCVPIRVMGGSGGVGILIVTFL